MLHFIGAFLIASKVLGELVPGDVAQEDVLPFFFVSAEKCEDFSSPFAKQGLHQLKHGGEDLWSCGAQKICVIILAF